MSDALPSVSPMWVSELAEITAMTLADFRSASSDTIAAFAVECHPAEGIISLALLTGDEATVDPRLADPATMQTWRHYGLERKRGMWRLAAGVERVMQESYHCAADDDRASVGQAYLHACGEAMQSSRVASELNQFERTPGFRISVPA